MALGPDYECHVCGRAYPAALVRVPRAWGRGGEAMAEAASLELPYPEAAVVEEDALGEQTLAVAADLPERPIVVGGCCCAHVGAIEALASRADRLAVLWLDAHGDLNTTASSPSGNPWATPLRTVIEAGAVRPEDVALVGARSLDPPEEAFIAAAGVRRDDADGALEGTGAVYVAVDLDVFDPSEAAPFMPEPDGMRVAEAEELLAAVTRRVPVAGAGFTGMTPEPVNADVVRRLLRSLDL